MSPSLSGAIDLSLDRVDRLLLALGHPERALPPVVHVAGTNGKGSLVAYLRAMAEAAGRRVHVYTSPHLVRPTERVVVAGAEIDAAVHAGLLEDCRRIAAGRATPFEIETAAAFLAFAGTPADLTLLETGLGGRLDATNVVARPVLTAITPVALDHQEYLGPDLAAIAAEKAGILKPSAPVVVGRQEPETARVIADRAAALGVALHRQGVDWHVAATDDGIEVREPHWRVRLPRPALAGPHQVDNAGMAVACARRLGSAVIPETALAAGLTGARWPARLQPLRGGALSGRLPPGWELWLDGGHNPAAAAALAAAVAAWPERPLDLVVGMLDSKDAAGFLAPLAPLARRLRAVPVPIHGGPLPGGAAGRDPAALAAIAASLGVTAAPAPGVAAALAELAATGGAPARVLVCGSLYLAGDVLAAEAAPVLAAVGA